MNSGIEDPSAGFLMTANCVVGSTGWREGIDPGEPEEVGQVSLYDPQEVQQGQVKGSAPG